MLTFDPYSGQQLTREELIDHLVDLIDTYFEENKLLKRDLEDAKERSFQLKEKLAWARDYSPFAAKACPLCTYRGGYFIKRCNLHTEIDELKKRLEEKGECS